VNQDWGDLGLLARCAKEFDSFISERLGFPTSRIAREQLDGIAAKFVRQNEALIEPVFDWQVRANARSLFLLCHQKKPNHKDTKNTKMNINSFFVAFVSCGEF
jgi:hypothetical protein